MLYYFFKYLHDTFHFPGAGLMKYISFRAAMATLTAFAVTFALGERLISYLQQKKIIQANRALGLIEAKDKASLSKAHTPTMGGILIILATTIPTLLFAKLDNIYIKILLVTIIWMGVIGYVDDYIKVYKKQANGINSWIKVIGQVILGCIVGATLYCHKDVVIREFVWPNNAINIFQEDYVNNLAYQDVKSTQTTIPFVKNHELDYSKITAFILGSEKYSWILYIFIVTFIICSVSNGANLTDGLDGLAAGSAMIISTVLAILAYLSGHIIFAKYLHIMYIPNLSELTIFCCAFVGACMGFAWYNAYPAQIFMGDTGSLTIGSIIAVVALCIRKELLLPLLCGIFLIENVSVILQVGYFRLTKKYYGYGKRIFKMAPLHHHYQKLGWHESKIVARFLILNFLFAIATLITVKIR